MSGEIRESFEKWLMQAYGLETEYAPDIAQPAWEAGRESGLRLAAEWIKGAPCLQALSPDFIAANLLALIPSEKDTQK